MGTKVVGITGGTVVKMIVVGSTVGTAVVGTPGMIVTPVVVTSEHSRGGRTWSSQPTGSSGWKQ